MRQFWIFFPLIKTLYRLAQYSKKDFESFISIFLEFWCSNIFSVTEHTNFLLPVFTWPSKRMLSQQGNDIIADWAYAEMISSLAEHTQKCLKVEYLSRIEYYFKISCYRLLSPKGFGFCKKVVKKMSCLCTFKRKSVLLSSLSYSKKCLFRKFSTTSRLHWVRGPCREVNLWLIQCIFFTPTLFCRMCA